MCWFTPLLVMIRKASDFDLTQNTNPSLKFILKEILSFCMKITSAILLLAGLLLQSCVSSEELAKIVKPNDITRLGYFTPISQIGIIEKGNKATKSEFGSKRSTEVLDSLIISKKQTYNIYNALTPVDSIIQKRLKEEISNLTIQASTKQRVHNISLSPTIDSVMEAHNERFALAFIATGFTRVKGNYGGQVAKSIGIGLLTMGMYVPTPMKASSGIHAVIFDSKNNLVAFYKSSQLVDKEPTDPAIVTRQVNYVLNNMLKKD